MKYRLCGIMKQGIITERVIFSYEEKEFRNLRIRPISFVKPRIIFPETKEIIELRKAQKQLQYCYCEDFDFNLIDLLLLPEDLLVDFETDDEALLFFELRKL